jgi:hypothetical protein
MADTDQVDDIPDVSLMGDDIQAPTTDTPGDTAADNATEEGAATQDETKEDGQDNASEGKEQPTEGEEPQQQTQTDDEAERRRQNEEYARRRIQERQRTKQAVEQQLDQTYGPQTAEELVEQGYSEAQARLEALEQSIAYKEQRTQIAELNASLQVEAVNVYNDFPVFKEGSPDYDPEFAQMVEQQYRQASRLQTDENGIVTNAEVPLYDFYENMARIYNRGATKGQQQGQQVTDEMLARTENPGGSSSTSRGNDLDELEERLGNIVL